MPGHTEQENRHYRVCYWQIGGTPNYRYFDSYAVAWRERMWFRHRGYAVSVQYWHEGDGMWVG